MKKSVFFFLIIAALTLLFINCEEPLKPCEEDNTGNMYFVNGEFSNYYLWPNMKLDVEWQDGSNNSYTVASSLHVKNAPAGFTTYTARWEDDDYYYYKDGSFSNVQCEDNQYIFYLNKKSTSNNIQVIQKK